MHTVTDQFCLHILIFGGCTNGAGLPMVNGGHSIEQVRQMGCTIIKRSLCLLIGGIRMGNGHGAQLGRFLNKLYRAGQFRSKVCNGYKPATALKELFKGSKIRIPQVRAILGTLFLLREEGAFHLNTHNP